MQEITFAKGNEQHLNDCRDALSQSTLGEKYFSLPGSAENAILEGIRQGNLYVALIGEECVGFTYIIPKGAFHGFPYLHIIAIKEEYRGLGVGKALLDYSESIASEMADKLFLVVADFNPVGEECFGLFRKIDRKYQPRPKAYGLQKVYGGKGDLSVNC